MAIATSAALPIFALDLTRTCKSILGRGPRDKHYQREGLSGRSLARRPLGAVAVSYGAIAMLVRKRGSTAATIAVLLGGIGALCGAIVNVLVGLNLAAAATAHISRDAAARFLVTNFNSGPGRAFTAPTRLLAFGHRYFCDFDLHLLMGRDPDLEDPVSVGGLYLV